MVGALALLLLGNLLVHLDTGGVAATADIGNRLGVATLLMLINLIGGRIVPSFTRCGWPAPVKAVSRRRRGPKASLERDGHLATIAFAGGGRVGSVTETAPDLRGF
jgi:uncharacterized protein involved in response to NO